MILLHNIIIENLEDYGFNTRVIIKKLNLEMPSKILINVNTAWGSFAPWAFLDFWGTFLTFF